MPDNVRDIAESRHNAFFTEANAATLDKDQKDGGKDCDRSFVEATA